MTQSVSDSTLSPAPFSPFSSYSEVSGVTSDDAPDLGAFTTVFRALNTLQLRTAPTQTDDGSTGTPISSLTFSPAADDSEVPSRLNQWSHRPLDDYLSYSSPDSPRRGRSPLRSESESTASDLDRTDLLRAQAQVAELADQPSLGDLDDALGFLAAERARLFAQRKAGARTTGNTSSTTTTSDSIYRHVIQPRRKRRRKRNQSEGVSRVRASEREQGETTTTVGAEDGDDGGDEAYASSSSVDNTSSPSAALRATAAHARFQTERGLRPAAPSEAQKSRLIHSKSTPNLIPPVSLPLDARVLHLRNLAHKLRLFFPDDAAALRDVLHPETTSGITEESGFIDTRGPEPGSQDTLIHVFIDHSNILIGFLQYLRRHLHHFARNRSKHLSHAALALILERGRPITRRVLVASSPLYQPVDTAEQLGYEVRVYARVPDTGDGADRQHHAHHHSNSDTQSPARGRRPGAGHARNHSHKSSIGGGGTSTESETNGNGNGNGNGNDSGSGNGGGASTRVRFREQGVDELLQLKLHQAIADVDDVPHGATIVLATGDGNVGQFNEEGFLGCVRTALKKGWRVELYAWEGGLSNTWKREFGEGAYRSRFEVYTLDRFAADLLEV